MKKSLITAILLFFVIGMVSCNKDDKTNQHTDGFSSQPEPTADGVYNPTMKIATIAYENNSENWIWGNHKLSAIQEQYAQYEFSYIGEQMSKIVASGTNENYGDMVTMTTNFTYNGNHLTTMVNEINDEPTLSMTIQHNANDKISHIDIEMSSINLSDYIDDILGFLNPDKNNKSFDFNSDNIYADLNWDGNNMNQLALTADGEIMIKVGNIQDLLNLIGTEHFGNYAEIINLINLIDPNREIPISLEVTDTTDYTFDSYNNPYYGFLYSKIGSNGIMIKGLSQNNILTSTRHGAMKIVLDFPLVPGLSFDHAIPIPASTQTYQYQYNTQGFPVAVTEKYKSYTITYSE